MISNYSNEHFFNSKKIELIASFFSEDSVRFEKVFQQIYTKLKDSSTLEENAQKAINQIQVFFSHHKDQINSPTAIEINKKIKKKIAGIVRFERKSPLMISYENWQNKTSLSEKQLKILYKTTTVFQISSGCSNYCRRCNEWALPGARKHFKFNGVKKFTTDFFNAGNKEFIYYGASDPLDWQDGQESIVSIIDFLAKSQLVPAYGLLTKLPIGKSALLEKLVLHNTDISISQTNMNRKRVSLVEKKTGRLISKQHDDEELMIPSGLDEDFTTVKSTINDSYGSEITPDGAYIVIPAFTSILNLTGQKRIPITSETTFFLPAKTGRKALSVIYFKPFEAINLNGDLFRLNHLLDVQVENILLDNGSDNLNPPGLMNLSEFFKTFEKEAVLRKKKMLPSIIEELKGTFLENRNYKQTVKNKQAEYKKHLNDYLILCSEKKMKELIKFSFSYFLNAIASYLIHNPLKRIIILQLKNNVRMKLEDKYRSLFYVSDIENLFCMKNLSYFDLFQILLIRLVIAPTDPDILNFITKHPAVFDEGTGLFIKTD